MVVLTGVRDLLTSKDGDVTVFSSLATDATRTVAIGNAEAQLPQLM